MLRVYHLIGELFSDLADTVVMGHASSVFDDLLTCFLFDVIVDCKRVRDTLEIESEINVNSSSLVKINGEKSLQFHTAE